MNGTWDYSTGIQFLIFTIYSYHGTHVMCDNWNELSHLACATVYPRLPGVRLPLVYVLETKNFAYKNYK